MRVLALIAVLAVSCGAASVDAEREEIADRLAARAQQTLDGILGPGRSQVRVEVQGERSEINSEAEILLPIEKTSAAGKAASQLLELPGYSTMRLPAQPPSGNSKEKAEPPQTFYQKEHEASRRDAGFQVKSIQATVVLDSALDESSVREVAQLLPQLLKLDMTRGDALSVLRAPMRPAWKSAFATPSDWRSAAYAAGAALVALLGAMIGGLALMGAGRSLGRSLGRELSARRVEPSAAAPPPPSVPAPVPLPELTPGAGGFLDAAPAAPGPEGAGAPLLGRRFDFLSGREPELVARALAAEKPEDLSLFFGHLAESIPDLASRLFAHLPPELQSDISQSLLKLSVADPERLGAIEERLRQAVENGVMGPQSLGRLLSRVPGDARATLLGRLAERDARAVEEVERHVFSFEDLGKLEAAARRRLLAAVPYELWGAALRGAPGELAEAVLADLPEGPRESVRAAAGEPQKREKVAEARSKILDALAALAAKGEVALGRGAPEGDML